MLVSSLFEPCQLTAKLIFSQTSNNIPDKAQILKFDSYEKDFILNDEATFEYFKEKAILFSCQLFHRENKLYVFSELCKEKSKNFYQQINDFFKNEIYKNLTFRKVKSFFLNSEREAVLLNNVFTSHFVKKGFDKIKLIFSKDNQYKKIMLLIVSLDKENEEVQQKLQRKELQNFIKKHFYLGCDMRIGDEKEIPFLSENEKNLLKNKFDFFLTYAKHCYPEFINIKDSNPPFSSSIDFFGEGKKDNLLTSVKKMLANFSNYLNFTIIVDYDLKKEVNYDKELMEKLFYHTSKIKINEKFYCAINIFVDYQVFEQLNSLDQKSFTTSFIKNFCELQEKNSSVYEILLEKILTPSEKKEFFKYDFDSNSKLFDNELINFDVFPCYINSDSVRTSSTYTYHYIRKFKKRKNFSLFRYEMHSIDSGSAEEEKQNPSPASLIKNNLNEKSNKEKEEAIKRSKLFNTSGFSSNDSKEEIKKQTKKTPNKESESESSGSNLSESSEENVASSKKTKSNGSNALIKNNSNEKYNKAKEKGIKRSKPSNISECSSDDLKEEIKNIKKKYPKKESESESSGSNLSESSEENFTSSKKTGSKEKNVIIRSNNESDEERKSNKNVCKFSSQEKNGSNNFHSNNNRSHTSEQKLKNIEQYEERKTSHNNKIDQKIVVVEPKSKKEHTEKFPFTTPNKASKKKESLAPKSDDKKEIKQENNIFELNYKVKL